MTFEELGLGEKVLKAVADAGYETPTPIQQQAIPHVLMGKDVLGIAQTGTGKTASFTLPMIEILGQGRAKARMPRSLILTPTRELAAQIADNFETYGKYHKLTMALLIGGVSFDEQNKLLDRGVDVLIATPGRLLDQFERGKILLSGIEIFVVDEADRMLDMGFIPDLEKIFNMLPFTRQTLFFSATMPAEIQRLTESYLFSPARVEVARRATAAENITQEAIHCARLDKRDALRKLLKVQDVKNAIIFCNRKRDVDVLYRSLAKHGFSVASLHGDMDQANRTKTLERFKNNEVQLLVASDVAARGLDIPSVSHVFNFDVPGHPEDYVHRIGRTGRAGRDGQAFTIVGPEDRKALKAVEALIQKEIKVIKLEGLEETGNDAAEASEEDDNKPRRRSRRGGRGRARRGSEAKGNDESETQSEAAPENVEAKAEDTPKTKTDANPAEANEDDEDRPRRRRGRRGGRGRGKTQSQDSDNQTAEKGSSPAEEPQKSNRKSPSRNGKSRNESRGRRNNEPEQVKPSHDELPAFLFRSID